MRLFAITILTIFSTGQLFAEDNRLLSIDITTMSTDGFMQSEVKCANRDHDGFPYSKVRVNLPPDYIEGYQSDMMYDEDSQTLVTYIDSKKIKANKKYRKRIEQKSLSWQRWLVQNSKSQEQLFYCDLLNENKIIRYIKEKPDRVKTSDNLANLGYFGEGLTKQVAIYGDNNYRFVNESDIASNPRIDEDLKEIIRGVRRINIGTGKISGRKLFGSAIIMGRSCDKVLTVRHNTHGKLGTPEQGKLRTKDAYVETSSGRIGISGLPEQLTPWVVANEGIKYNLKSSAPSDSCVKDLPVIRRQDVKKFQNCMIIGFPEKMIIQDGYRVPSGFSGVDGLSPRSHRGMAPCKILGIIEDQSNSEVGKLFHNCDTLPGSSGGPIVCKPNGGRWSLVGINNGGKCRIDGKTRRPECYAVDRGPLITTADPDNLVYGTAGTFLD